MRISPALVIRSVVACSVVWILAGERPVFAQEDVSPPVIVSVSVSPGTVDMTGRPASSVPRASRAGKVLFTKGFNEQLFAIAQRKEVEK